MFVLLCFPPPPYHTATCKQLEHTPQLSAHLMWPWRSPTRAAPASERLEWATRWRFDLKLPILSVSTPFFPSFYFIFILLLIILLSFFPSVVTDNKNCNSRQTVEEVATALLSVHRADHRRDNRLANFEHSCFTDYERAVCEAANSGSVCLMAMMMMMMAMVIRLTSSRQIIA